MRTIDAVRRPGIAIAADQTIHDAAKLMESAGVGTLAVLDGDQLVGIVTDRDLVRRAMAPGLDPTARVDAVMTMPVQTVDADADLHDTVRAFETHGARRLAVTEAGRFVGIISVDDLVIDLVADLGSLVRPVTGEVMFSQRDVAAPVAVAPAGS